MLRYDLYACLRIAAIISFLVTCYVSEGNGGSDCLPREDIHPCTCTAIQQTKKLSFNVVTCSHIRSTKDLFMAFVNFRRMEIDRFIIIDSFLETKKLYGNDADEHQTLPQDWLSRLKIRELEIVDSSLSECFICSSTAKCRNQYQTHLTVTNSSATEKICSVCSATNGAKFSWTGCMTRIKYFRFTGNNLAEVRKDLFPERMNELSELSLASNRIVTVGANAFKNLPKLSSLDLSHNLIKDISGDIFGAESNPNLKFLDLSWNEIAVLSGSILTLSPGLVTLNLHNNQMKKLKESDWKDLSGDIKNIDLTDNPICCDCDLAWLNASLKVHTNVLGICDGPSRFEESAFRQASRLLAVACKDPEKKGTIEKCPN